MKSKDNRHKKNLAAAQLNIVSKKLFTGIFLVGMILSATQVEALAQTFLWTRQFGTTSSDFANAITTDSSGIYVAGDTYGTLSGQTGAGMIDAFVRKSDADGNELWTRQFGSSSTYTDNDDHAYAITADSSGIYIAGSAGGTLPGQANAELKDAFVRKYDADGNELWTRQFGTTTHVQLGTTITDVAYAIIADSSGIYVAGRAGAPLADLNTPAQYLAFVRKFDADGNELWTRQFGTDTTYYVDAKGITADSSGVYIAGSAGAHLPGQTSAGMIDAFVCKLDADGNELWIRQFGTTSHDFAYAITAVSSGIYVAGYTNGALPGQTYSGENDAFVRKFDADGNELWTRQFGTTGYEQVRGITADSSGIFVDGYTTGTLPGQISAGMSDAFVRKYDADGNELWTRQFGSSSTFNDDGSSSSHLDKLDYAYAITADSSGLFIAGNTGGSLPGQTYLGMTDAYISKISFNEAPRVGRAVHMGSLVPLLLGND